MQLKTVYLDSELKNPLVAGSLPLFLKKKNVLSAFECGASAVTIPSFFNYTDNKEKPDINNLFADSDEYITYLRDITTSVSIPVFLNVNISIYADLPEILEKLKNTGIKGIELSIIPDAAFKNHSGEDAENKYLEIIKNTKTITNLPVSMKALPWFSALPDFLKKAKNQGLNAAVLFSRPFRFYIDTISMSNQVYNTHLSKGDPSVSLFWISRLCTNTALKEGLDLCGSTGIYEPGQIIEYLISGADAVQTGSVIYRRGFQALSELLFGLKKWLTRNKLNSMDALKSLPLKNDCLADPALFRKKYLSSFIDPSDS